MSTYQTNFSCFADLVDTNMLKMEKPVITKELTEEPSIQQPPPPQHQQPKEDDKSPLSNSNTHITLSVEDDNKPTNEQQKQEEEHDDTPKKAVQKNKGRCFSCRSKVKRKETDIIKSTSSYLSRSTLDSSC